MARERLVITGPEGWVEPEGIDTAPMEMSMDPTDLSSPDENREPEVVQEAKARKEAFLKRLQKLYNLDRDEASLMMDKIGGLDKVISEFQMREEKDLKKTIDKYRPFVDEIKGKKPGIDYSIE